VEIAGGLDVIEQGAFHGCRNLQLIISGCKLINQEFSASTGVSHVEFSHELDGFAGYAFARCGSLEGVTLPSVMSIDKYAFTDCSSLTSVKIPSTYS
jgi:hypothetical protein